VRGLPGRRGRHPGEKGAARAQLYLAEGRPARLRGGGGVAANGATRAALQTLCEREGVRFVAPPLSLCTDNAAMIAWVGIERARACLPPDRAVVARPRWPLDEAAAPLLGAGRKGAKA
jgi:N6-L-threonylcarbamoyladenine synthase